WISELQQLTGNPNLRPMIYTTPSITHKLSAALAAYPLWIAWYVTDANAQQFGPDVDPQATGAAPFGPWGYSWTFLQYNVHTATVAGISSIVDVDVFNGDAAALASYVGGTSTDVTPPTFNSFDVSPRTVIEGQGFILSYSVADSGGSGLRRIEIRRA